MHDRRSALRELGRGAAGFALLGSLGRVPRDAAAAEDTSPRLNVRVTEKGNSSLFQLRRARGLVPVDACAASVRGQIRGVLEDVSIYRKMPEILCETDPQTLEYFLSNPDIAVALWRSMGVSQMTLREVAGGVYDADGGDGSSGRVHLALARQGERVIYCAGQFVNPVAKKPIKADCVVHFRNRYERASSGAVHSRHSATMFVRLASKAVEATARVISPVSNRIADRNFEEVSLFIRMMSEAMRNRPGWCEQVGRGLAGVSPEKIDEFLTVAARVHASALRSKAASLRTAGADASAVR